MAFVVRYRFILLLALVLLGFNAALHFWFRGRVVASLVSGEGYKEDTFYIREIPTKVPGANDGYAYRCEVWADDILMKAATYRWDSYTARKTSIEVVGADVVFHIDDRRISCAPFDGGSDSQWKGGFP